MAHQQYPLFSKQVVRDQQITLERLDLVFALKLCTKDSLNRRKQNQLKLNSKLTSQKTERKRLSLGLKDPSMKKKLSSLRCSHRYN